MLGRGLESLIPAGGYRKPEEPSRQGSAEASPTPSTNAGGASAPLLTPQQPASYQYQEPSYHPSHSPTGGFVETGSAHTQSAPASHTAYQPAPASDQTYPGGYRQSYAETSPSIAEAGPYAETGPSGTEADSLTQSAPAAPRPAAEQFHEYRQHPPEANAPRIAPSVPPAPNYYPTAMQESEPKPAVAPYPPAQQNYGAEEEDYSKGNASVFQIEVERIFPNPHQPRRHFDEDALNDLANSIREFGIIQPLVVTKVLKETESGTEVTYQLIAGERRLMAAKKVGLRTVPAVVKRVGMDRERLELAIIENIQRENLNPLEAARSYARLQDEFGLTQREIAIRMGKSRETIANTLRLLNLPSEIQQALEDGRINESHARLLLQIDDIARQKDMFQSILHSRPSVRELKATIKREKTGPSGNYLNPELISLQSRLEEFLGTKAQIDDNGGRGKITINYYSPEELSALIGRLSGEDF